MAELKNIYTAEYESFSKNTTANVNNWGKRLFFVKLIQKKQFFNLKALQIVRNLNQKLSQEIRKILVAFVDCDRIKILNERELNDFSLSISSIILQQIDFYIANRKETVRLNPESGVGTLFALPSDDNAIEKAIKSVEAILSLLQIK